jgi:hypothetical protein
MPLYINLDRERRQLSDSVLAGMPASSNEKSRRGAFPASGPQHAGFTGQSPPSQHLDKEEGEARRINYISDDMLLQFTLPTGDLFVVDTVSRIDSV